MPFRYRIFILSLLLPLVELPAQGIVVPIDHPVYEYLQRLSLSVGIEQVGVALPLTRIEVTRLLRVAADRDASLTDVERDELAWYQSEFAHEWNRLSRTDRETAGSAAGRWRLFQYADSSFRFYVGPILGFEAVSRYEETQYHRWNGISAAASLGDNWGFRMEFRDHWEKGERLDRRRDLTGAPGFPFLVHRANSIEYDDVQGAVSFQNEHLLVGAGKEVLTWGSGYRSQLILSRKAPSFPSLRLAIRPVDWMRFHYVHGWLNSRIPDSSRSYTIEYHPTDSTTTERMRVIDRPKYYAAHVLEFIPHGNIRFSLGESVVYSDEGPLVGYLVPVLFFRLVDHYYEGGSGGKGSNSQIFADLDARLFERFRFYGTLFIDEFSLTNLLEGETGRNQFGYTVGGNAYGLLPNLMIRAEYTRILPWVYSNKFPAQFYTNSDYLMGHYIGQNADQIFAQADYRVLRGLEVRLWGELIRRGGFDDLSYQTAEDSREFLYGPRRTEKRLGIDVGYEILHELFARFIYRYSSVDDEETGRAHPFETGTHHEIGASLSYGL